MLDSTPDLAHPEQLSQVIRYVNVDYKKKKVQVKETFVDFLQLKEKDAASIVNTICEKLE